ncbi:hypothetical protein BDW67DRAFT_179901 [Aspergillus spinulosporus]
MPSFLFLTLLSFYTEQFTADIATQNHTKMSLIPIICTHEVSPAVLSTILSTAYKASSKPNSPPSLLVLTTADGHKLRKYKRDSVTKPPIDSFQSPFLGWDVNKTAQFIQENASKSVIDRTALLAADDQTAADEDTLLVYIVEGSLETIRVSAEFVNSQAVSVAVATTDIGELRSLADDDGVYRGSRQGPPPRKQL